MKKVIKVIILVILGAITGWLLYLNISRTIHTYELKQEIEAACTDASASSDEGDKAETAKVIKKWDTFMKSRALEALIVVFLYALVLIVSCNIGYGNDKKQRITKSKAKEYAVEIEKSYRDNNLLATEDDDTEIPEAELPDKLKAPKLGAILFSNRHVTISWGEVEYAQGYYVYRKIGENGWKNIAKIDANTFMYLDYALDNNTDYIYSVKAFLVKEEVKILSPMDKVGLSVSVEKGNKLEMPVIRVEQDEDGRNILRWEPVEKAKSYYIYRQIENEKKPGTFSWKKCANVTVNDECEYIEVDEAYAGFKYAVASVTKVNGVTVVGDHDMEGVQL